MKESYKSNQIEEEEKKAIDIRKYSLKEIKQNSFVKTFQLPPNDKTFWKITMTLLLRDGGVVVGTGSGELMLLEADSIQKQMHIGGSVWSAVEVEDKLYVG